MLKPLITLQEHDILLAGLHTQTSTVNCSLDLNRSTTEVAIQNDGWIWQDKKYPYLKVCKDRTIYAWDDEAFQAVSRFTTSLIKLVPTHWGPPTFEIDGIKMLPTAKISPYADAEHKVNLIQPRGKVILDTCGGLGYFAAWCLLSNAKRILSFEKNMDVVWLRQINPWSPKEDAILSLTVGDICEKILTMPDASADAILHDPPRFGIAGELYAQTFYDQLARVAKRKAKLFHYTGTPNKLTSGRDVPNEVAKRLQRAGFMVELSGDGVLAIKK